MARFAERIKQRSEHDQVVLEESFFRMASVVMDWWGAQSLEDERLIAKEAIDSAYSELWDEKTSLFRLFSPAYDKDGRFPGYLAGYCPGFRENGGQYTHAAVWGAMALLRAGETDKGTAILKRQERMVLWDALRCSFRFIRMDLSRMYRFCAESTLC